MSVKERYRVGDWVEVLALGEILATLDARGCLDEMPFMPEMMAYCGKRLRVARSAHKACDPTGVTNLRRMDDTVLLTPRCDGAGHDGCQAQCLMYWKTAWLRPAAQPAVEAEPTEAGPVPSLLADNTRETLPDGKTRFRCQATQVVAASRSISSREFSQYVEDVQTGNVTLQDSLRHVPKFYARSVAVQVLEGLGLRQKRNPDAAAPPSPPPPAAHGSAPSLNLAVGDVVQVRSRDEIAATLDESGKHLGMSFDKEMFAYCGKTFKVTAVIRKIIDERSGRMIRFRSDCIVLDRLHCLGLGNPDRLFCPRAPLWYWREEWLRRAA
ncbi:MAG: hypothetical protein U1E62_01285 [Alsobacter sp.]